MDSEMKLKPGASNSDDNESPDEESSNYECSEESDDYESEGPGPYEHDDSKFEKIHKINSSKFFM